MKATTKLTFLDDQNEKFFGEGPARLMRAVEKEGSLLQAAKSMQMAYSKAYRLIRKAEAVLGFPLLESTAGGISGGGSHLTPRGLSFLIRYEQYRDACRKVTEDLYRQHFPEFGFGCVIMASGLGKRFGGNKLMADFGGVPLIHSTLLATDHLFVSRVTVTRSEETAAYLRTQGIDTILHDLPGRNDTVRLGLDRILSVSSDIAGCLFCQADQPLLTRSTITALLQCAADDPASIWRPECGGIPGSPVWFPRSLFPELLSLPEGKGGGALIRKYPERVRALQLDDPYELRDIDTEDDLEALKQVRNQHL